jgi:hypothetical protein
MAPVTSEGVDQPVNEVGQWFATGLTYGLAIAAIIFVVRICLRERIAWPAILTVSGGLTCLMEPLFDHLYGLWFYHENQWHLYTTFGSSQPVWVPAAYVAFYGGATVIIARTLARHPQMSTVWAMYASIAAMALVAEITYISILHVYCYQDSQPFVVFGYPVFLGFTNAMSAVVSGIVAYRLVPLLRGAAQLYLLMLVPSAFAMGLFGGGILYLSVRHSVDDPNMVAVYFAALTVVGAIAWTISMLGKHLVAGQPVRDPDLRTVAGHDRTRPGHQPVT